MKNWNILCSNKFCKKKTTQNIKSEQKACNIYNKNQLLNTACDLFLRGGVEFY